MAIEIKVPALGESVSEATVAKWHKKRGDAVKADEAIVELETDKVTLEINAPAAGVLTDIVAGEGVGVGVGALLGVLDGEGAVKPAPKAGIEPLAPKRAFASTVHAPFPSAAKLMAENQLQATALAGSGKDGRVTKGDVLEALAAQAGAAAPAGSGQEGREGTKGDGLAALAAQAGAAAPAVTGTSAPLASAPRGERVRMTRLRKRIAERLKQAQNTAAILTTFNEVDLSAVMAFRNQYNEVFEKKYGVKLGFMSIFVKACLAALKEIPSVNAEIDGDDIVYKNYYDIGVAVGTEQGLVVPVLRHADQLGFAEIEKKIAELGKRARDGKLSLDDLQGGTFTISNGGIYGSLLSTPILNTPQSGILGMHKIQKRPIAISDKSGDRIEIRPMMYLALSYDHRIIDGREAVTFLVMVKDRIEDPRRLLFEV